MKTSQKLLHSVISFSLLAGVATSLAVGARLSEPVFGQGDQYRHIEQPIFRIGWTLGGVALMGILISGVIEGSQEESSGLNQNPSIDRYPLSSTSPESASSAHCAPI